MNILWSAAFIIWQLRIMIEGIYWFGEYERWNLGWPNPNVGGAFVAMLIPLCWWLQVAAGRVFGVGVWYRKAIFLAVLAIEFALWLLLMKTYSRGALVAVVCGAGVWLFSRGCGGDVLPVVIRLAVVAVLLLATGFVGRVAPGYVGGDASAINRLRLWEGGLCMVAAEPWRGWGEGESGVQYMHWYQPVDATEGYAGMVNSWLHRAVEHGLPSLFPWLWLIFAAVGVTWRECRRAGDSAMSATVLAVLVVWVVFAVANVFSTLWIFKNLWWAPGVAGGVLAVSVGWRIRCRRYSLRTAFLLTAAATGGAVAVLLVMWLAGLAFSSRHMLKVTPTHFVIGEELSTRWLLIPDADVLGRDYGKRVRILAEDLNRRGVGIVVPRRGVGGDWADPAVEVAVLMGGSCASPPVNVCASTLLLIHPAGEPRDYSCAWSVTVLLPAVEADSSLRRWRNFALERGWAVASSGAIGNDLRPVWPLDVDIPQKNGY